MASGDWRVRVQGEVETREKVHQVATDITGPEFMSVMEQASMAVMRDARLEAPVDTGRLKNSITADVSVQEKVVRGVVGSNLSYAPFMELGTRPHWPPIAALVTWARRHNMDPYSVALSIATRGLEARRFLEKSFEKNQDYIKQLFEGFIDRTVRK